MQSVTQAAAPDQANQELRQAMDQLIKALSVKTQTILRLQQQLDVLFQCVDSFCDLAQAGKFDEMASLVARYKQLTAANDAVKDVH